MWTVKFILAISIASWLFSITQGRQTLGGHWNRGFRDSNYTLEQYVNDLVGNVSKRIVEDGLNMKLEDQYFDIDGTLLGVTMKGKVQFTGGVVAADGTILPPIFALSLNRTGYDNATETYSSALVLLSVQVVGLETLYDLSTDLDANNIQGTVETHFGTTSLFFELEHKFETGTNTVTSSSISFGDGLFWTIKPRVLNTYVIEELLKRGNTSKDWNVKILALWQRTVLAPLLEEEANKMTLFPVKNN